MDGLYDRNPEEDGAQLIEELDDVSEYLDVTTGTSALGSGGMYTKMQAANMAQNAGCDTLIARGIIDQPITSALQATRPRTRCVAKSTPRSAWAVWLTDRLQMAGSLVLSKEAADALEEHDAGIECADVVSMHAPFQKADVLHIYDEEGRELARGMCNFSSEEAMLIARNPDTPIEQLLGYKADRTLVNRKNLVVLEDHHLPWEQPREDPKVIAA